MRVPRLAAALFAFLLAAGRAGGAPADEGTPLPVGKSTILREEKSVYTVEGRVRIPRGVELSVLKEIVIKAKGDKPAVIEVEGSLTVHGVDRREVIFENVTVEPCPQFAQITMDMTIFRGNTGGIKTGEGQAVEGPLQIELFDFTGRAAMDVTFAAGSIVMSTVDSDAPVKIRAHKPPGKEKNNLRVFMRGCPQDSRVHCTPHGGRVGLVGGFEIDGGDDVTLQLSRIGGSLASVANWGDRLIIQGLKVNSTTFSLSHRKAGMFQRVQFANCDIYSSAFTVSAPPEKGVKDSITVDRCWFKGVTDAKKLFADVIKDSEDDPAKNGVKVILVKAEERPHELAGPVER
jgi:hypothetical protein